MIALTKDEARAAYRRAWLQMCLSTDIDGWVANSRVMEAVVTDACEGEGDWRAFVESLPGFREIWESLAWALPGP